MRERKDATAIPAVLIPALVLILAFPPLFADTHQDSTYSEKAHPEKDGPAPRRKTRAVRISNGGIELDGRLDERDWRKAPEESDFLQHEPDEGRPSTERTTFRVVYDDDALYVGVKAYDSQPEKINCRLARRDNEIPSDWVAVSFDSYNDRRTAFEFMVNPAGVKCDRMRYNDVEADGNWDAVWDVETRLDADGWTAEFRIPFSQLRFTNNHESHSWGLEVIREIHRNKETSLWNPIARDGNSIVSSFGVLEGIERVPQPKRIEILPYSVGSIEAFGDAGGIPSAAIP